MAFHAKHTKVSAVADGGDPSVVRSSDWNADHTLTVDIGGSPVAFYDEGMWTPVISGETTAGAATYTSRSGTYTRIGRVVHLVGYVAWTAHTGAGPILLHGYTDPTADSGPAISVMAENLTYSGSEIKGYIRSGSGMEFWACSSASGWQRVAMDTSGEMFINGCYTL